MATPLDRISGLSAEQVERLVNQWITSAEQLAGLGLNERLTPRLAERLGMAPEAIQQIADAAREVALGAHAPAEGGDVGDVTSFGMGLAVDRGLAERLAMRDPCAPAVLTRSASVPGMPEAVDHVDAMTPIRDQGRRGTCVAFSTVATREFLAPGDEDHSEQFFYWACKQRDGDPHTSGTTLGAAAEAMREDGVCREATWPYDPSPNGAEDGGAPPSGACLEAREFVWSDTGRLLAMIDGVKAVLSGKNGDPPQPVVVGVLVFESSFFSPDVIETGRITLPFGGEPYVGGHTLCVVGYRDDESVPGGGYLVVRNSWGERWARHGIYGAGYGLMPYAYLRLYCVDALAMAPRSVDRHVQGEAEREGECPELVVLSEPQSEEASADNSSDLLDPQERTGLEAYLRDRHAAVLAILFSDIENYTGLCETAGEQSAARVRRFFHDETLRIVERDGAGWAVKNIGDSFLCVFAEPSTAVSCALEMQETFRRFRLDNPGAAPGGWDLKVRIGIDMGQVTVERSLQLDVFGKRVNRAARVMSAASGGQVFVTRAVSDSAQGWLGESDSAFVKWQDHGLHRLKGVEQAVEIHEVVDTRIAAPRAPVNVEPAPGGAVFADRSPSPPAALTRCSVCGREYASSLSLAMACEICDAPICQALNDH